MAPLIRPHTKSRNGCRTCRTRRVKCDEVAPNCGNCTRRDLECVWKSKSETLHEQRSQSPSRTLVDPPSIMPPMTVSPQSTETQLLDVMLLELMHHYTATVCSSLYQPREDPALLHVWKTIVPGLAFSGNAQFLLNAMLAVSALHLYHLDPTASRYAYAAARYYAQARQSLPSVSDLPQGMNKAALLVTNSFITICAFVLSDCIWARSDWLLRLRARPSEIRTTYRDNGMDAILDHFMELNQAVHAHLEGNLEGHPTFPASLSTIHLASSGTPDCGELCDPAIADVYAKAVSSLRHVWAATLYDDNSSYTVIIWFVSLTDRFMELLWSGRPRALVLVGHYCALMRRMKGPWWMHRNWTKDIEVITATVGERWRPWMDWVSADDSGIVSGYPNEMALMSAPPFDFSSFMDLSWNQYS